MSYQCSICPNVADRGASQLKHVVKRADGSIARELAVCAECHACLKSGYPLATVQKIRGAKPQATVATTKSASAVGLDQAPTAKPFRS